MLQPRRCPSGIPQEARAPYGRSSPSCDPGLLDTELTPKAVPHPPGTWQAYVLVFLPPFRDARPRGELCLARVRSWRVPCSVGARSAMRCGGESDPSGPWAAGTPRVQCAPPPTHHGRRDPDQARRAPLPPSGSGCTKMAGYDIRTQTISAELPVRRSHSRCGNVDLEGEPALARRTSRCRSLELMGEGAQRAAWAAREVGTSPACGPQTRGHAGLLLHNSSFQGTVDAGDADAPSYARLPPRRLADIEKPRSPGARKAVSTSRGRSADAVVTAAG
ncbi:hypothetical protein C8Q78DRAFT_246278 [Trametes maxima]|nr:hypothetical protein C8Q78DRAFT_246278 [Trametes maxima]